MNNTSSLENDDNYVKTKDNEFAYIVPDEGGDGYLTENDGGAYFDIPSFTIEFLTGAGVFTGAGEYDPISIPTIADNDWEYSNKDVVLDAKNYIQVTFALYDLDGNRLMDELPLSFSMSIYDVEKNTEE